MRSQAPVSSITDPRWLRAISHPIRIRVLSMLDEEPASPVILAAKLEQPLGTIAYHVRTLYDLGLLKLVSTRQRRGATEHYYQATARPRSTEDAWDALDGVSKQRLLTALLDRANEFATRSAAAGGFDGRESHLTSRALKLDREGLAQLVKETEKLLSRIEEIETECASRIDADPDSKVAVGVNMMVFEALPFSAEVPRPKAGSVSSAKNRSETASAAQEDSREDLASIEA